MPLAEKESIILEATSGIIAQSNFSKFILRLYKAPPATMIEGAREGAMALWLIKVVHYDEPLILMRLLIRCSDDDR